jgi:wyosine [tRNA(Phe)-imidazoG37] synthetase (radical SAM superfamily)
MSPKLTTTDHSRDVAGLKYVYPVISRRAGGLSIGVNFNTNNACNWRCIYCQVPGLIKGAAPDLDLPLLAQELSGFIQDVLHGDFYGRFQVPEQQRLIKDVAISGNGEPTTTANFAQAMALIGEVVEQAQIPGSFNTVLITNGSLMHQQKVQQGLVNLHEQGGRVWFKLDSATREGQLRINNAATSMDKVMPNLVLSSNLCPTWLQTCVFLTHDQGISQKESDAYLEMLAKIKGMADIKGILLYTLARPSHQPEADSLAPLPRAELNIFAEAIKGLGFEVKVSE